jgi:LPXTG cell wall anchor motif
MRTRNVRLLAAAATAVVSLAPAGAASATAAPTQTVDGFTIDASVVGVQHPSRCLNATTGEWVVDWNFSVTTAINGFSVTAKSASAGGFIVGSQVQPAVFPAGAARTITFTGSQTYFGKDAVTQTVTYDLLAIDTAAPNGKSVTVTPIATTVNSPCTTSPSIATTTTTISSTACSCTPTSSSSSSSSSSSTSSTSTTAVPGAAGTSSTVTVLGVTASPTTTVAVLAVTSKPKALPRTGGDVRSLLATAGAFVIVGVTLAALPRRRTPGR